MSHGIVSRTTLFEQLGRAGRITEVSAPAGSGKTTLLRSWGSEPGRAEHTAYVSAQGHGRDPQQFWLLVIDALRGTAAGSALVRPLTAAPDLDGWMVVQHLLADLGPLRDRTWLMIDDLHELADTDVLPQLQLLLRQAPETLRLILATRHDSSPGLHRLRLDGELTEIRAASLRFTLEESRALFEAAGTSVSERTLVLLQQRTEGWAAGLRLAALSLAGHPDPDRFADEFSGSERTVAEYLLAEVLEQQPEPVRQLLLRTSVLERVNGQLADLLTGSSGGERILLDLERAGAFVVAIDAQRSWFRYHRLFAELLQLELRRTGSAEPAALHRAATDWYAAHGFPVEAVRHAQAARDWNLAVRLLSDHWVELYLDGQSGTTRDLVAGFPASVAAADAEITAVMAAAALDQGLLSEASRLLARAARGSATVPVDRRGHFEVLCIILQLRLARRQGNLPAVTQGADRLLVAVETADMVRPGLGPGLHALALISLGSAEVSAVRPAGANRHLEEGIVLARRIGRPYLELAGLAYAAQLAVTRSYTAGAERSMRAIELARQYGWSDKPVAAVAWAVHADALIAQGRLAQAQPWLDHAQRTLRPQDNPVAGVNLHYVRAGLELARGEYAAVLATLDALEPLARTLVTPHVVWPILRAHMLHALIRMGRTERAEQVLAEMDADERGSVGMRIVEAALRIARADPQGARDVLAALADDAAASVRPLCAVAAFLLDARACDALDRTNDAGYALERALEAAEPDHVLFPFLVHPAPGLLERHARGDTAYGPLIGEILGALGADAGGTEAAAETVGIGHPDGADGRGWLGCAGEGGELPGPEVGGVGEPERRREQHEAAPETAAGAERLVRIQMALTGGELRVLRYLPTNLSAPEIAAELSLSVNTIRTHMRHVYEKLGAHSRNEAVELARSLGLVASATVG